jgi:hypothetical protein
MTRFGTGVRFPPPPLFCSAACSELALNGVTWRRRDPYSGEWAAAATTPEARSAPRRHTPRRFLRGLFRARSEWRRVGNDAIGTNGERGAPAATQELARRRGVIPRGLSRARSEGRDVGTTRPVLRRVGGRVNDPGRSLGAAGSALLVRSLPSGPSKPGLLRVGPWRLRLAVGRGSVSAAGLPPRAGQGVLK